ncbi:hypothetical protein Anas_03847, partial [Armadillidium nasatum]
YKQWHHLKHLLQGHKIAKTLFKIGFPPFVSKTVNFLIKKQNLTGLPFESMKSTTIISCLALILSQNVPLRTLQISDQAYDPRLDNGGYYKGRAIGALGNAADRSARIKALQAKGFLIGDPIGNIVVNRGLGVNGGIGGAALLGPRGINGGLGGNIGVNGGLGINGVIGGNNGGELGNLAGVIIPDIFPEIPEIPFAVLFKVLGRDLGVALLTILDSGVGGIIATEKYPEKGCTYRQISGIVKTIFSDMKIHLQECTSNDDCRGIAKERCGLLPKVPPVGPVCLFS